MSLQSCSDVARVLGAYLDDELPGAARQQVAVHLASCAACAAESRSLGELGEALRFVTLPAARVDPVLAGLASGITSRFRAEQALSWGALWNRAFDDWHWVAVGLGSVAGALMTFVFASAILASSITQLAQMNARAGTLYLIALPEGGRGGAVVMEYEELLGTTSRTDARLALPASFGWQAERALVSALDEKLMSSGRPSSLHGLSRTDRDEILALLSEIAEFRYQEPARRPGGLTNVSSMHLVMTTSVTAAGL